MNNAKFLRISFFTELRLWLFLLSCGPEASLWILKRILLMKQRRIQNDFHTGIPVWEPKSWLSKMKYVFIYTIILDRRLCFFLLNLSKVYF